MATFSSLVQALIDKVETTNGGVFLGLGHDDQIFSKYLSVNLCPYLKDKNVTVYAEGDGEIFRNSYVTPMAALQTQRMLSDEKLTNFNEMHALLSSFPRPAGNSVSFLALLLNLHFSGVRIIHYDYVPLHLEEKQRHNAALDILHGRNANVNVIQFRDASLTRVSGDEQMASKISNGVSLAGGGKFVVMGGPAHVEVARILRIDALNVLHRGLYDNALYGTHSKILAKLKTSETYCHDNSDQAQRCFWSELDLAVVYKAMGNHYMKSESHRDALSQYQEAVELNPEFKEAWLNKGIAEQRLLKYADAGASFQKALDIDPGYAKARRSLDALKSGVYTKK